MKTYKNVQVAYVHKAFSVVQVKLVCEHKNREAVKHCRIRISTLYGAEDVSHACRRCNYIICRHPHLCSINC